MNALPEGLTGELLNGRYDVHQAIGHGGMSTVYRASDRSLGRDVAVKVIRHDPAIHGDRAQMRERFRREAANAARIAPHPNVVQIYDYGTDPDRDLDFIVMELLDGRDLKAVLGDGEIGTARAVHVLLGAARGLAAGHRAGIVHRDVKPANILVAGAGADASVRVLDFGIAKALGAGPDDDLTRVGPVPHTPAYASPEQQRAGAPLSAASDVYQLGLIAYELLAGERPFDADDRARIASGEDVPLSARGRWGGVPAPLRAVVERALRAPPGERYPDAAAFAEAWSRAAESDRTVLAPGAGPTGIPLDVPSTRSRARSRPAWWESARRKWAGSPKAARVGAVALLCALLLWAVLRGRGGGDEVGTAPAAQSTLEQEEKFAPLYDEAAERLADEAEETP